MPSVDLTNDDLDFLRELYRLNFTQGLTHLSYRNWCEKRGVEYEQCQRGYDRLTDSGVVESAAMAMTVALTASGVIHLENNGLVEPQFSASQDECRKLILRRGFDEHQRSGRRGLVPIHEIEHEASVPERVVHQNLTFLRDIYAIEFQARYFKLTHHGLQLVEAMDLHDRVESRWNELRRGDGIKPQARGHALEELLADTARNEGLDVKTRVRASGEENDLVISKGHDHFLVSCKWEKKRAPNHYLESLRMRLLKRPGTFGILVSVGGFSKELVKEAEGNTSLGMVMLFGRGDLDRLFTGQAHLREMMLDRHMTLARYRRAVFEE